jgi:hypothetical protein
MLAVIDISISPLPVLAFIALLLAQLSPVIRDAAICSPTITALPYGHSSEARRLAPPLQDKYRVQREGRITRISQIRASSLHQLSRIEIPACGRMACFSGPQVTGRHHPDNGSATPPQHHPFA